MTLEAIQSELKYAFKWMARATKFATQGEFSGSTYAMTVAQQHWNDCQHYYDRHSDEFEKVNWNDIVKNARELAEKELAEDDE